MFRLSPHIFYQHECGSRLGAHCSFENITGGIKMLRWIATKLNSFQMEERVISILRDQISADGASASIKNMVRNSIRINEGSGANEFFCAAATIIGLDEEALKSDTLRSQLKRRFSSLEDLRRHYNSRQKIVEMLYSKQIEADQYLPKDIYRRIYETAEPYWK